MALIVSPSDCARRSLFQNLKDRAGAAFAESNRILSRPLAWWTLAILALALQTALILTHWPWPDEYQALQLAVQAPDIATLLEWLRYEGHPPLWYLILRALAHLMDPLDTLWVAALLFAIPTQCLILFASPFTRAERLLIVLSEFLLFDFLTISRGQTMGVMLLVLAVALWRSRWIWLVIALLPFCDFLFGVISGIFVLLKWREKGLWWPGMALWFVCGLLAAWTVFPAPDMISAASIGRELGPMEILFYWLVKLSELLIPFQGGIAPQWNTPAQPIATFAWIGFILLCWLATRDNPFHRLMLLGMLALTLAFSLAVYPLGLRHLMLVALLLILLTWLARTQGAAPSGAFRVWLVVIALCGMGTAAIALTRPFDTAHLAVAEIRERGLEGKHWMIVPDWRVSGLAALSGMRFERPEKHCMLDFIRWDHQTNLLDGKRLEAFLRSEIERHGRSYLVSDLTITGLPEDILAPLVTIPAGYDGIDYHLYVVGRHAEEKAVSLPDCVPVKRPLTRF